MRLVCLFFSGDSLILGMEGKDLHFAVDLLTVVQQAQIHKTRCYTDQPLCGESYRRRVAETHAANN